MVGILALAAPALGQEVKKPKVDLESMRKAANHLLVLPLAAGKALPAEDADAIAKLCPAAHRVAAVVRTRAQVTYGERKWTPAFLYGTTPSFLDVRDWRKLAEGAAFTDEDVKNRARVCVIGQTVKAALFGDKSPVGREVRIKNVAFEVVGVLSARGADVMGWDQDDIVLAPWTTVRARVAPAEGKGNPTGNALTQSYPGIRDSVYPANDPLKAEKHPGAELTTVDQILVRTRKVEDNPAAVGQITELLHKRHKIKAAEGDDFRIRAMMEIFKALATPSIVLVRKVDRGKREVTFAAISLSLQPAKGDTDKKKPPVPPTLRRELREYSTGLKGFEFVTAAGKRLSDKEGWERLKAGTVVVFTSDPRGVAPGFRSVLAADALMIVPLGWEEAQAETKGDRR
jgi:hypothetical protein